VKIVEEVIISSFSVSAEDLYSEMVQELLILCIIYLDGLLLLLTELRIAGSRGLPLPIRYFCKVCIIDGKVATNKGLSTGKVDRVMAFDALI